MNTAGQRGRKGGLASARARGDDEAVKMSLGHLPPGKRPGRSADLVTRLKLGLADRTLRLRLPRRFEPTRSVNRV